MEQSMKAHAARARNTPKLSPTGVCLYPDCELPLSLPGQLYCNAACERAHNRPHHYYH